MSSRPPAELPTHKNPRKKRKGRHRFANPPTETANPSSQPAHHKSPVPQRIQLLASKASAQPKTKPTPPMSRELAARVARYRRPAVVLGSILALAISFRIGFTITAFNREAKHYARLDIPLDVSDRWKNPNLAQAFDEDIDTMEWIMGISRLRRRLLTGARGHVLETSAGTGRNAPYYPLTRGIKSVTMVDTSAQMIHVARITWARTNAWFGNALFRIQSAADPVPLPAPEGFDTVVQTMGLCSTPEPEKMLRNLGRMCRQDGEGRILLLEHGRSYYDFLNRWIDKIAPVHADRKGCWFNKDIGQIVRDSGLEIYEQRRFHFGTTWWFELRPAGTKALLQSKEPVEPHPWLRAWSLGITNVPNRRI